MAKRVLRTYWIHPAYDEVIKKRADDLGRSDAYIMESCVHEMFRDMLPVNLRPGQKVEGDDK